ncbi:MAG: hypothetical protein GX542_13080 [Rhodococcus sp.]|nr:hypothetical protein [Rhodococcus sp. (in: high G+C Gram-positive bacteria)]
MVDERPLLPSLDNDPAMAARLRKSLSSLAASVPDPAFKKLVGEVLDGKTDLRSAFDTSTFSSALGPLVANAGEKFADMPDEEREALAEQGRAHVDAEYAAAKAAEAKREEYDPTDDDDYFDNPPPILQ